LTPSSDLAAIERRLEQVENALADAQARVPALRREVTEIRKSLARVADGVRAES